jgi:hypothetical protein
MQKKELCYMDLEDNNTCLFLKLMLVEAQINIS